MDRDRRADLDKLADAVIERLETTGDRVCGLDAKRPFGFSGHYAIAGGVLEIIGWPLEGPDDECDEQYDYAHELLANIPDHVRSRWKASRDGEAKDA